MGCYADIAIVRRKSKQFPAKGEKKLLIILYFSCNRTWIAIIWAQLQGKFFSGILKMQYQNCI
jgi:hypothetical protein